MADNDNEKPEVKEEKPTPAPSLEQVHDSAQRMVEEEAKPKDEEEQSEDDNDQDNDKSEDQEKPEVPEEDSPDEDAEEEPEKPAAKPAVDDDTNKASPDKIAVKDYSGKTFYFNNLDEVPDDFEPANYKEWGRAVNDFAQKAQKEAAAEEAEAEKSRKAEQDKHASELQKSWDKDIKELRKSGGLPKDKKDSEKLEAEVFGYMEEQLKDGVVIDSFSQAFKAMSYDKQQAEKAKKETELKKQRGGMVMSSGSGTSANAPRKGVMMGVPSGVSLDAVHERALSEL